MTLIPVETPEDFLLAQQFIIPHEETCTTLASLVRRRTDKLIFLKNENEIAGILSLDSTIYHCIPDINLIDNNSLQENLPYLMKKPVRCISGETSGTEFLVEIVNSINGSLDTTASRPLNHPEIKYPYRMLRWSSKKIVSTSTTTENGEEIIRCTEHDMEILHPLQKDYMKGEVAVPGRQLTDAEVDITLRQILKNQLCFALTVDGDIVAKANTNAIGINCIQIGGVYTHPLYRRNGYAGALVQALCNRASQAGRKPVLFVKEKNTPAFNLYQKLGFEECGHYMIAYY